MIRVDDYVFEGLRAGAAGFLVKDTDPAELIRAVRVVAGGEALLSPKITLRLIGEFAARSRPVRAVPGLASLTAREREVVTLVAAGLSNEEIAARSYMSTSTAKTHAARAMTKLGARDRAQSPPAIFGFPGVSAVGPGGHQYGSAAARVHADPERLVTLAYGATAHVLLQIANASNFPASACRAATAVALRVYPPNDYTSIEIPFSFDACKKAGPVFLFVRTTVSGTGIPGFSS